MIPELEEMMGLIKVKTSVACRRSMALNQEEEEEDKEVKKKPVNMTESGCKWTDKGRHNKKDDKDDKQEQGWQD